MVQLVYLSSNKVRAVNSRKKHLILAGVPDKTQVDADGNEMEVAESNFNPTHAAAFSTLQTIHDTLVYEDIDLAYRVGRKGPSPRPITVKFIRENTRNEVNRKRFLLKDSDETNSVFLNEDLPAKVNAQRADLRCIVGHAKAKNISAKTLGNKISVDNKIYSHRDIDKLPEGLKLSDAKTIETTRGIAFQSHHSFPSNFYSAPLKYNGVNFATAEHAYQYTRSIFLGSNSSAADIQKDKRPQVAKNIGINLPSSPDWDACKQKIMKEIVFCKFAQNPQLQPKILETGDKPLLEATYDSYWGCGLPLSARKLKQGDWHGKNYLGLILVDCRNEIRRERFANGQQAITSGESNSWPALTNNNRQQSNMQSNLVNQRRPSARAQQVPSKQTQPHNKPNRSQPQNNVNHSQSMQTHSHQHQQWPTPMMYPPPNFQFANPLPNNMPNMANYYMYPHMQHAYVFPDGTLSGPHDVHETLFTPSHRQQQIDVFAP